MVIAVPTSTQSTGGWKAVDMPNHRRQQPHYHGHVTLEWTPSPAPTKETFEASLHGSQEVSEWLVKTLRSTTGKPDMALTDEAQVWSQLVQGRENITTGIQFGTAISAVPMPDGECWCERPALREVPTNNKRRG